MRLHFLRVLLLLCIALLLAMLPGCDLLGSDDEPQDVSPSLIEGEYDAYYFVRFEDIDAPEGQDPKNEYRGKLVCVFFGEKEIWDCAPLVGQLVTAGGPYEINEEEIFLDDVNAKRANFNWGLSPVGKYDYDLDGDTLTLMQEGADSPDYYSRDYHRIVLVKRDTSEYEYLSGRSSGTGKERSLPSIQTR